MSDDRDSRSDSGKHGSSERASGILNDPRVRRGIDYIQGDEFREDRRRFQRGAGERLKNIRDRYRHRGRTPEEVARERELSLRLAEVEAEAAEARLRLSELLEEEHKLRSELEAF
ncbi:hypothetical protein BH20ACT11_BH20ACT11_00010 [soil metagenome]|jgi:hypothetical protein